MIRTWLIVIAAVALTTEPAKAQTWLWSAEGTQSVGYGTNILGTSAIDPSVAESDAAVLGWALDLRVDGFFSGGWSTSFSYSGALDLYLSPGSELIRLPATANAPAREEPAVVRQWHEGAVRGRWRRGAWNLQAALVGGGYHFSAFESDAFGQLTGRLQATYSLDDVSFFAAAAAGGRWFASADTVRGERREDLDLAISAGASVRLDNGFSAVIGYQALGRDSNVDAAARLYHVPYARFSLAWQTARFGASWSATIRESIAATQGLDVYQRVALTAEYRALDWLTIGLRYGFAAERAEVSALSFDSHDVSAFLRFTARGVLASPPILGWSVVSTGTGLRTVRFTTRIERTTASSRVSLVGDFNGWNGRDTPLTRNGDGTWTVDVTLAPGRYEYQYLVDGKFMAPPEAVHTVSSAFGGTNGVLQIE